MKTTPSTKPTNNKSNLKEAFALWNSNSKGGDPYLTGKTSDEQPIKLVAFFNTVKKNPKQPDIQVYVKTEKGKERIQVASLWETTSKAGKQYLSGSTNDNEKIIGFFNKDTQDDKYPFIRVYYKEQDVKE